MSNLSSADIIKPLVPRAAALAVVEASPEPRRRLGRRRSLDGQRFGRLVVRKSYAEQYGRKWFDLCNCDCGKECLVARSRITSGRTQSCGCLRLECNITHGLSKSPTHRSWAHMIQRATNPNNDASEYYSGRGITVCERWKSFDNFLADMGLRPDGLTLERKNVNGNYDPCNCEWATRKRQMENRRNALRLTHNGETLGLKQWAVRVGIPYRTLAERVKSGMSAELALTLTNKRGYVNRFLHNQVPKDKRQPIPTP